MGKRRATIEVALLAETFYESRGSLTQNRPNSILCCIILVYVIKPWDCSSGSIFLCFQNQFLGEVWSSSSEASQKSSGVPLP